VSVPTALNDLRERVAEFGPVAFLLTVGDDRRPHIVSVHIAWEDGDLVAGAGRTTATNATHQPAVSLLWSAVGPGDYGLIVDGTAEVQPQDGESVVRITPSRAVLHRLANAGRDGPTCITLL
jgi:hypothetical protein